MTCKQCMGHETVSFALVPGGQPMHYNTCSKCECGWWTRDKDGSFVDFDSVLALLDA